MTAPPAEPPAEFMPNPIAAVAGLLLAICQLTVPLAAQSVRWTPSFADALAQSQREHKVLMLAFNMAGERANDELVADHYRDATLGRLSQHTVNVFCSTAAVPRVAGVGVGQQQEAERLARLQVLKIGPGEDVIAPQHVFVHPDGTVLSSVPYRVTKGELEWVWVDAIRKVDATFAWQPSEGARAPGRLELGGVGRGANTPPPTKQQVEEALKTLKKSRGGVLRNLDQVELLLHSDDAAAIAFVDTTLRTVQGGPLAAALDSIGVVSPKVWHAVVTDRLDDRDANVRCAAARALEHLAEPKALPALRKQYRAEKDERARGRLLRAMASCGPSETDVRTQIDKVLAKEPAADVRAHAVLALALVEDRDHVLEGLTAALRDGSAKVRATAAFALAMRRDATTADRLAEAASREEEPDTKAWLDAAVETVRGGDGKAFASFEERVLGEPPVRAGLQGLGGGGGRRGG